MVPCRKSVEKRGLLENMEGLFLAVDEIVDGGWVPAPPWHALARLCLASATLPGCPRCPQEGAERPPVSPSPPVSSWRVTPSRWCTAWQCGYGGHGGGQGGGPGLGAHPH